MPVDVILPPNGRDSADKFLAVSTKRPVTTWAEAKARLDPFQQLAWLRTKAVVAAIGFDKASKLSRDITKRIARARRRACSQAIADEMVARGLDVAYLQTACQCERCRGHRVWPTLYTVQTRGGITISFECYLERQPPDAAALQVLGSRTVLDARERRREHRAAA